MLIVMKAICSITALQYLPRPFFETGEQLVKYFIPSFESLAEIKYSGIDHSDCGGVCYAERSNKRCQEWLEKL
jgi:hypothetical protein